MPRVNGKCRFSAEDCRERRRGIRKVLFRKAIEGPWGPGGSVKYRLVGNQVYDRASCIGAFETPDSSRPPVNHGSSEWAPVHFAIGIAVS